MAYYDLDKREAGLLLQSSGSVGPAGGGINSVLEYQISGIPYAVYDAADTEQRIQFPYVTQWVQITATTAAAVKFSFKKAGTAGSNYGMVAGNTTGPRFDVRCSEIYVLENAAITAGLTTITSGSEGTIQDTLY